MSDFATQLAAVPEPDEETRPRRTTLDLKVAQLRIETEAQEVIRREKALKLMRLPPERESYTLASYLAEEKPPKVMRIEGFQGEGHKCLFTAKYKVGKTTATADLTGALVDGRPFMGAFDVIPPDGCIGHWNAEMDGQDFEDYLKGAGVKHVKSVKIWNWRGYRMDLMSDVGAEIAAEWLSKQEVAYWIMDPWSRICAWSGISENSNDDVSALLQRVDEIATDAGVKELVIVHHEGWAGHTRGATALPGWADAIWHYTSEDDVREISTDGRGIRRVHGVVELHETAGLLFTGATRKDAKQDKEVEAAIIHIRDHPGIPREQFYKDLGYGETKGRNIADKLVRVEQVIETKEGRTKKLRVNPDYREPEI